MFLRCCLPGNYSPYKLELLKEIRPEILAVRNDGLPITTLINVLLKLNTN